MKPIPKAAMPIVEYIRENVTRPKELPRGTLPDGTHLRWLIGSLLFCPLGLCKESNDQAPHQLSQFNFDEDEGEDFAERNISSTFQWWDEIPESDAHAACDAIWGER